MCTHAAAKKNIIFRWGIKPKSKTKHNFVNFVKIETWQLYLKGSYIEITTFTLSNDNKIKLAGSVIIP